MSKFKVAYYNKDYTSIREELIQKIQTELADKWTDFSESDLGMILLELFAGIADMLSYNMDNQVREAFLNTALRRSNVARLAFTLGYSMKPKQAGTTKVSLCIPTARDSSSNIPLYTSFRTAGSNPVVYSALEAFSIPAYQSCVFQVIDQPLSDGQISTILTTDVALQGINIPFNTDHAKIYALIKRDSVNKIALFSRPPIHATLDTSTAVSFLSVVDPAPMSGVTLSNPIGLIGVSNLRFVYNGGTGMTLSYRNGVPVVVDAGGVFVLEGQTTSDKISATVNVGSLPIVNTTVSNVEIVFNNVSDNRFKIAYGTDSVTALTVALTAINNSGVSGSIKLTSNLSTTIYTNLKLYIDGPNCFEGSIAQDTFIATGLINQVYNTNKAVQQLPTSLNKLISVTVGLSNWTETTDMYLKRENLFLVETIEYDYSAIKFGDGDSGNIPTQGSLITATYIAGTGATGAIGSNSLTIINNINYPGGQSFPLQCNNITAAVGAVDEETIDQVKAAALSFFKSRGRSVNEEDYEARALEYREAAKINPAKAQAYKDTSVPDFINHLLIYVLGVDPRTGRATPVTVDLTAAGGLYEYLSAYKVIPEGLVTEAGVDGLNTGVIVAVDLYWNITLVGGYDAETVKLNVAEALKVYFHSLTFQQTVLISNMYRVVTAVEGVQSCGIYTDAVTQDQSTAAYDLTLDTASDVGKIYALPEAFYTNHKSYIKLTTDATYG